MSETSANLGLPFVMPAQAQKHVTVNESLQTLDALVMLSIKTRGLSAPPESPTPGDRFIPAAPASGDWSGQENSVAIWQDMGWQFFTPAAGWQGWIADEDLLCIYDGVSWQSARIDLSLVDLLGLNTSADATNRLAVASEASLFSHDGAGHQLKLNKAQTTDTASLVFQTAWSGRAEFGLAGEDAFSVKVSPDGSNWITALTIDPDTAEATFQTASFEGDISTFGESWRSMNIYVASDNSWGQYRGLRARGTQGTPTAVLPGDTLLAISALGHDGTAYVNSGGISFLSASDYSVAVSSAVRIAVINNGSWLEVMRLSSSGNCGVGIANPKTRLDVAGPVRPQSYQVSGLPVATGIAGAIVYVTDAAGGAIPAFSDGTDWRRIDDRSVVS